MPRLFVLLAGFALMASMASAQPVTYSAEQSESPEDIWQGSTRLRPLDAHIANMLLDGLQRSRTLRALAERIEQSDVIVLIGTRPSLRGRRGALAWLSANGVTRYVRAAVLAGLKPDAMIATIGHELQHALEVAESPSVTSQQSFADLYKRIGMRNGVGIDEWDTLAARRAGEDVGRELKVRPSLPTDAFDEPLRASDWQAEYQRLHDTIR